MDFKQYHLFDTNISCSIFDLGRGSAEYNIVCQPSLCRGFEEQFACVVTSYSRILAELGLSHGTEVLIELYLSDAYNQSPLFADSDFIKVRSADSPTALSIMQLPPVAEGVKLLLRAYHLQHPQLIKNKHEIDGEGHITSIRHGSYIQYWLTNFCGDKHSSFCSANQTEQIMARFESFMVASGLSFTDHLVRTWFYIRDIDNHYAGMVSSRKASLDRLIPEKNRRYMASTGIEGAAGSPASLVTMNALVIGELGAGQMQRMVAPACMNAPSDYGVTFERGIELSFGDRKHLHISGTASINNAGEVVHAGNVVRQAERTLQNIGELLNKSAASFADLAYLIVYLRDFSDYALVRDVIGAQLPEATPVLFLRASVCRPSWLIEIEGTAIVPHRADDLPAF